MDLRHISLRLLRFAVEDTTYRSVLEALAEGIRAAGARVDDAADSDNSEWREIVNDEECELAENLLGAAFVVCQTQITAVTSRAQKAREAILRHEGGRFLAFGVGKKCIRDLGEPLPPPANATKVDMLWALANYFKHREEWPDDWTEASPETAITVSVIQQAGLTRESTGNLRTAAEYFGNPNDYTQLSIFADIIDAWAKQVVSTVKTEFGIT